MCMGHMLSCSQDLLDLRKLQGEQAVMTLSQVVRPPLERGNQVIEGQLLFGAAILALKFVAEKDVKTGKGRISAGFDKGLERDDAGQSELEARTSDRRVIFGDDVHPVQKHCLDGVLPTPQGQGG